MHPTSAVSGEPGCSALRRSTALDCSQHDLDGDERATVVSTLDHLAERASRWMASRTSRRTFLATTGKTAVVVAGGATLASVFATRAEARACGQSGVSPRCPTYDCVGPDVVWGWCWYASPGCCTNGGLKKICDCCKRNHPNVHGYCPDGHNVYCMVESCLEDPRLQKVALERSYAADAADLSLARLATRPAGSTPSLVIAAADVLAAAIAGPLANSTGTPLVLTDPVTLRPGLLPELSRLGVRSAAVVAAGVTDAVLGALRSANIELTLVGSPTDIAVASVDVAILVAGSSERIGVVCIGADGTSLDIAASASAYAASIGSPLLIGTDAVNAFRGQSGSSGPGLVVGDGAGDPSQVGEGEALRGRNANALSRALADRLFDTAESRRTFGLAFVPASSARLGVGYLPVGGPLLVHDDSLISPDFRDWLVARRVRFAVAECVLTVPGGLSDAGVLELQGALNGYDRQFLRGDDDGVGLPVFAQPLEERPIGMVRLSGDLPSTSVPGVVPRARHKRPIGFAPAQTPPPRTAPGAAPITTSTTTTTTSPPVATSSTKATKK